MRPVGLDGHDCSLSKTVGRAGALVGLLVTGLIVGCSSDDETARCVPPRLVVAPSSGESTNAGEPALAVGAQITATGSGFAKDCKQGGSDESGDRLEEQSQIRLYVAQGDNLVSVAAVEATGRKHSFQTTFGIPEGLVPGPAKVLATADEPPAADPLASARIDIIATGP